MVTTIKIEWFDYVREEDKRDLMEHSLSTIKELVVRGVISGDLSYETQDESSQYEGSWNISEQEED